MTSTQIREAAAQVTEGQRVMYVSGPRTGQAGTVARVKGPKTVEVRMDAGFVVFNVKVSQLAVQA